MVRFPYLKTVAALLLALAQCEDLTQWTTAGWYVQVDGVMGGKSSGNLKLTEDGANFDGTINLNGGGFASFRRNFGFLGEKNMGRYAGLWVEADVVTENPLFHVPLAIHLQLGATIDRGSTLWNKGNPELCGAMYHATAQTLASSSNVSSAVVELAQVAVNLAQPYPVNWGGEGAWIYRKAFDHMLAAYEGSSPPGDGRYPAVASGGWATSAISNGNFINPLPTTTLMADMQDQISLNFAPQKGLWQSLGTLLAMTILGAL